MWRRAKQSALQLTGRQEVEEAVQAVSTPHLARHVS